eukprot:TRINITY_DN5159_c0_g1_i1.p1 TRINITY_DN5159_c0_g1~~TRINITY_DN5159_c0_g1_i1.p1  ORF type:complete len:120 (-),score=25.10 TRINITY_DN5159_c0_g1_i1:184-543(-)
MGEKKSFKEASSFESRKTMSARIKQTYPDRIPVIVEKAPNTDAPDIEKNKFLVPNGLKTEKFIEEVRLHVKLRPEQGFFLFVGKGTTLQPGGFMIDAYSKFQDPDGFLYVTYAGENTFG